MQSEIPLIGSSIWEGLADSWRMLILVLMALAGAYNFIEMPGHEFWCYIVGSIFVISYL